MSGIRRMIRPPLSKGQSSLADRTAPIRRLPGRRVKRPVGSAGPAKAGHYVQTGSFGKLPHHADEIRLTFESNARQLRHSDVAVLDAYAVGKSSIRLKQVGITLVAA